MIIKDKIIKNVCENIFDNGIIKKKDLVIVALSGGPDSMCLFDILYKLADIYEFDLKAVHIHHGIRGLEADEDLLFVEKYCKSFDVKLIRSYVDAIKYSKDNSLTLEEAARKLRYKEFEKIWKEELSKRKNGNVYIACAHHMKDQVETIVHNILRGTGLKGISGMQMLSGYIVRPLINISKDDINYYVKENDIPYVVDKTNKDLNYTRNFIREEILDKFLKVNDKAFEHIYELSLNAKECVDYIEKTSHFVYEKLLKEKNTTTDTKSITLDLKLFKNTSHIIEIGVIRIVINELVFTLKDITKINFEDVIDLTKKEKGGHLDLPYNITCDKKKDNLIFTLHKKNVSMSRKKHK